MEAENNQETTDFSLTSRMTFSSLVTALNKMGVESYRVDLAQQLTSYQMLNGEAMSETFRFDVEVAEEFNDAEIRSAIIDIKLKHLEYKDFLRRLMKAGTSSYTIFMTGRKVIFYGRNGDCYIENFPHHVLNQH